MKILVTGAAGFIGSWTVSELEKKGYDVVGTDKVASRGLVQTDVTSLEQVKGLVAKVKPEVIIHLAAISGSTGKNEAEQSMRQPQENFLVNVQGTTNLYEASRLLGVRNMIYMSSFAVYGRTGPDRLPISPDTPVSLEHAYAVSKYMGELVARTYSEDFGIKSTVFRAPFVAGENQTERNVVKEFIDEASKGAQLVIYGEGSHVREFVHPIDLVNAFDAVVRQGGAADSNFDIFVVGNTPTKIRDLASKVVARVGRGSVTFNQNAKTRAFDQRSDYSKATKKLSWIPKIGIDEIIDRIVRHEYSTLHSPV